MEIQEINENASKGSFFSWSGVTSHPLHGDSCPKCPSHQW